MVYGLITLGGIHAFPFNTDLGEPFGLDVQRIAPLWDEWFAAIVGRFEGLGDPDPTNDRLVVEWNNAQHASPSVGRQTFQAILQLNTGAVPGAITFNYLDLESDDLYDDGASATVGMNSSEGTLNRVLVSFNSTHPWVGSRKAIRLTAS